MGRWAEDRAALTASGVFDSNYRHREGDGSTWEATGPLPVDSLGRFWIGTNSGGLTPGPGQRPLHGLQHREWRQQRHQGMLEDRQATCG
jgi:hypothetical protein